LYRPVSTASVIILIGQILAKAKKDEAKEKDDAELTTKPRRPVP
jgi:hypothetical protein